MQIFDRYSVFLFSNLKNQIHILKFLEVIIVSELKREMSCKGLVKEVRYYGRNKSENSLLGD